jgi:hypothetical protein
MVKKHSVPTTVQKPFLKAGKRVYFLIFVNFHAPESGSAFQIRVRIQDSQTNADPDPQHCLREYFLQGVVQILKVQELSEQMVRTAIALYYQPGPVILLYRTCQLLG